jgi:heme-degrading monooxygenase HmoA
MLCAHTVRRLKPGTFDQFTEAFMPRDDEAPAGWVRFHLLRGLADPNEVVTFGFFDGTLEQLEGSQRDADFESRRDAIAPFVDAVIANGVYEIVESRVRDEATPA